MQDNLLPLIYENRRSHTLLPRYPKQGMRTEQIAEMINRQQLHIRKDGQPVTSNQVYAVICGFPDMFVKAEVRIMLMI